MVCNIYNYSGFDLVISFDGGVTNAIKVNRGVTYRSTENAPKNGLVYLMFSNTSRAGTVPYRANRDLVIGFTFGEFATEESLSDCDGDYYFATTDPATEVDSDTELRTENPYLLAFVPYNSYVAGYRIIKGSDIVTVESGSATYSPVTIDIDWGKYLKYIGIVLLVIVLIVIALVIGVVGLSFFKQKK
jgi:hypothetical protein